MGWEWGASLMGKMRKITLGIIMLVGVSPVSKAETANSPRIDIDLLMVKTSILLIILKRTNFTSLGLRYQLVVWLCLLSQVIL